MKAFKGAAAVTQSDTVDLPNKGATLYIGVAGDVKITTMDDDTVVLIAHPVGYSNISVRRVWDTGTAATDIVALF